MEGKRKTVRVTRNGNSYHLPEDCPTIKNFTHYPVLACPKCKNEATYVKEGSAASSNEDPRIGSRIHTSAYNNNYHAPKCKALKKPNQGRLKCTVCANRKAALHFAKEKTTDGLSQR